MLVLGVALLSTIWNAMLVLGVALLSTIGSTLLVLRVALLTAVGITRLYIADIPSVPRWLEKYSRIAVQVTVAALIVFVWHKYPSLAGRLHLLKIILQ
jgi:hypothetical protein